MNMQPSWQDFLTKSPECKQGEIELCVFGKGIGECLVINNGLNQYVIVDSFLNPATNRPIALDYLDSLHVTYEQIALIVISHWHADHIEGILDIVKNSSKAHIIINPILKNKGFQEYIAGQKVTKTTSLKEFTGIWDYCMDRPDMKNRIHLALADKLLLGKDGTASASIYSLSPSDSDFTTYIKELITSHKINSSSQPNLLSIVLLIKGEKFSFAVLGGDLESSGWNAIFNDYKYYQASVFKVPHHGSYTGYNEGQWTTLLQSLPDSVLTPFTRSSIPNDDDIVRLCEKSSNVYIAGEKKSKDKDLTKVIAKYNCEANVIPVSQRIGLVRIRWDYESGQKTIDCFGSYQIINTINQQTANV